MTRICNFPIAKDKRCGQPVTDDKPDCGKHETNLSARQLGQDPATYQKDGESHICAGESNDVYCLNDPTWIEPNSEQRWHQHGRLHRDDGPAVIWFGGFQEWYQHGKLHRDGEPAVIWPDGTLRWYQHGERHRDDGPAVIKSDGEQRWCQHDELHREDGPALIRPDGTQWWCKHGQYHREDGPAIVDADGTQEWYWYGKRVTEEEYAKLREQSRDV